jgi:FSR family fosmidomycin resistance protein-like MFS transporter
MSQSLTPQEASTMQKTAAAIPRAEEAHRTAFRVLGAISFAHLLNDMMQSLILAIYPLLKDGFHLSFGQIGLITLTYQVAASLLQPVIGYLTDRKPKPYSLPIGMGFTLVGLLLLAYATSYPMLLVAAALVGTGSSVFHPESSRVARLASGGQHGLAQSLFQVGGNLGSSLGPVLAAVIIVPQGQHAVGWFSGAALLGIIVLLQVSRWYANHRTGARGKASARAYHAPLPRAKVIQSMVILMLLVFTKYFYLASLNTYLTFYLIEKFGISVRQAEFQLFLFLFAVAVGTIAGGPIGDRIGRKYVIWGSILGAAPFALMLPFANLFWTGVLTVIIGLVIASAFSAILVHAQELVPSKIGTVSGLFFGFAFGIGGIAAAALGALADETSIVTVYQVCSYLPLLGVIAVFLPSRERIAAA